MRHPEKDAIHFDYYFAGSNHSREIVLAEDVKYRSSRACVLDTIGRMSIGFAIS
jgi:hypothetical protein